MITHLMSHHFLTLRTVESDREQINIAPKFLFTQSVVMALESTGPVWH